jgi:hypothetical protein
MRQTSPTQPTERRQRPPNLTAGPCGHRARRPVLHYRCDGLCRPPLARSALGRGPKCRGDPPSWVRRPWEPAGPGAHRPATKSRTAHPLGHTSPHASVCRQTGVIPPHGGPPWAEPTPFPRACHTTSPGKQQAGAPEQAPVGRIEAADGATAQTLRTWSRAVPPLVLDLAAGWLVPKRLAAPPRAGPQKACRTARRRRAVPAAARAHVSSVPRPSNHCL